MIDKLKNKFKEVFEVEVDSYFFAPGRVNLIGEHTDYNGGNVFPCALDFGTYALVKVNNKDKMRVYSENFKDLGIIEFSLDKHKYIERDDWANYVKGVIDVVQKKGYTVDKGLDILFYGNIPNGAGLSSSASLELCVGVMLNKIFDLNIKQVELVKIGQKAENEFVGVQCGIMDQFAIGMGRKNHAILLDCNKLEYSYAPIELEGIKIVITNTNKRRGLADSKYNERRSQCESALKTLQSKLNIHSLGELSIKEFEANKGLIRDNIKIKRVKHAVYENQRTIEAVTRLKDNDIEGFGQLMNESHISLRDDYEVTGRELDTLVEAAWKHKATIGSRMTGAGFGGCTVSLVKEEYLEDFIEIVGKEYFEATGLKADFYVANIGDGARELDNLID